MFSTSQKSALFATLAMIGMTSFAAAQSPNSFNAESTRTDFTQKSRASLNDTLRALSPIKARIRELTLVQQRDYAQQSELIHRLEDANKLYFEYYENKLAELRIAQEQSPNLKDWSEAAEKKTRENYQRDTMYLQKMLQKHHEILAKMKPASSPAKPKTKPATAQPRPSASPVKKQLSQRDVMMAEYESKIRALTAEISFLELDVRNNTRFSKSELARKRKEKYYKIIELRRYKGLLHAIDRNHPLTKKTY